MGPLGPGQQLKPGLANFLSLWERIAFLPYFQGAREFLWNFSWGCVFCDWRWQMMFPTALAFLHPHFYHSQVSLAAVQISEKRNVGGVSFTILFLGFYWSMRTQVNCKTTEELIVECKKRNSFLGCFVAKYVQEHFSPSKRFSAKSSDLLFQWFSTESGHVLHS